MFRVFNDFTLKKKTSTPDVDVNCFIDFFSTIGEKLAAAFSSVNETPPVTTVPRNSSSFVMYPTNEEEVFKIHNQLRNKNSIGHDGLSTNILKYAAPVISKFLSVMFNKIVSNGIFPDFCKIAKVVPILKEGDNTVPSNFRSISLVSAISKLFENMTFKRMIKFIQKYKLLREKNWFS